MNKKNTIAGPATDAVSGPDGGLDGLQGRLLALEGMLRDRFHGLGVDPELGPRLGTATALFLQELGDQVPAPLFFVHPDGHASFINRRMAELLQATRAQLEGRPLDSILPACDVQACLEEAGRDAGGELERMVSLPGGRGVRLRFCPVRGEDGTLLGLFGVAEDRAPWQHAQTALLGSEERFRGLLHLTGEAVLLLSDGHLVEANPAALRLLGRGGEELAGLELDSLLAPGQPSISELARRWSDEPRIVQTILLDGDGRWLDVELSFSRLEPLAAGTCLALLRDVRQRRRAEAALQASEEFNRRLVEDAPVGVLYLDPSGVVVHENPAMMRMRGQDPRKVDGAVGRALAQVPGLEGLPVGSWLEAAAQGARIREREVEIRTPQGLRGRLLVQVSCQRDDGFLVGLIVMAQDVTQSRELERQLRQAQKLEALGGLAGGLAHEFNNLLTGISGNAELAMQLLDRPQEAERCLREQVRECQRAAELTRRLLAFSRHEEGEPRPLLLNRLLEELEPMLRRTLGETIELVCESGSESWAVRADAAQLEQVVVNLAVNARDAMPDGGRLHLRVLNRRLGPQELAGPGLSNLEPGRHVVLEVEDTGHGISEEVRARMFEPFFTTKERGRGTGLGLSIVGAVLARLGGAIQVDSRPGQGACFRLLLPSSGPLPVPVVAARTPGGLVRGEGRILVLEDEDAVRNLLERLLAHLGYEVLSAGDGEAAFRLADSLPAPPDLILSDVIMPGLSGPAIVKRLLERWPGVPVLFCSGYTGGELTRHDLSVAGGVPLLAKPFTLESLGSAVRQAMLESGPVRP